MVMAVSVSLYMPYAQNRISGFLCVEGNSLVVPNTIVGQKKNIRFGKIDF